MTLRLSADGLSYGYAVLEFNYLGAQDQLWMEISRIKLENFLFKAFTNIFCWFLKLQAILLKLYIDEKWLQFIEHLLCCIFVFPHIPLNP